VQEKGRHADNGEEGSVGCRAGLRSHRAAMRAGAPEKEGEGEGDRGGANGGAPPPCNLRGPRGAGRVAAPPLAG
jgi:hypothetical protein